MKSKYRFFFKVKNLSEKSGVVVLRVMHIFSVSGSWEDNWSTRFCVWSVAKCYFGWCVWRRPDLTDRCWRKREEELDGLSRTLLWNLTCAWMPLQSCLTLHDPVDRSPPGSSVHGILLARILELVAIPPPGDLPDPGVEPASPESPALQADSLPLSHQESPCLLEVMPKQQVVVSSRLVVMWNPKPYQ